MMTVAALLNSERCCKTSVSVATATNEGQIFCNLTVLMLADSVILFAVLQVLQTAFAAPGCASIPLFQGPACQ